jgi:hypothetical protein
MQLGMSALGQKQTSVFSVFIDKGPGFRSPGLFREHDEIGPDSGLIAQGIVRDDKCGAYRQ